LRHMKLLRRASEAQFFGDRYEVPQMTQFHGSKYDGALTILQRR
jgi:hypothetical protein